MTKIFLVGKPGNRRRMPRCHFWKARCKRSTRSRRERLWTRRNSKTGFPRLWMELSTALTLLPGRSRERAGSSIRGKTFLARACFASPDSRGGCRHIATKASLLAQRRARNGAPFVRFVELADVFGPGFEVLFDLGHKLVGYGAVDEAVVVA